MWGRIIAMTLALTAIAGAAPAQADAGSDKTAITERLRRWKDAFDAKDRKGVCDLFAPDLIYSVPELVDGTRPVLCEHLAKILGNPRVRLHYDRPQIL